MAMTSKPQGFTLIEIMITLTVLAFLLFLGAPLTSAWTDGAQQQTAASLLREGIGRAKAQALRNPGGVRNADEPAAALCYSNQTLVLYRIDRPNSGTASVNCAATSNIIWSAALPSKPAVKLSDDNSFSCSAFNNQGLPITAGNTCTTLDLQITVTTQDAINVPLI